MTQQQPPVVACDHTQKVWDTQPYMVWGRRRFYLGRCARCGRIFQREQDDDQGSGSREKP